MPPPGSPAIVLGRTAIWIALAAAASPISQLTLAPSFGAIPSSVNHAVMIIVTFSLSLAIASRQSLLRPRSLSRYVPTFLLWVPAIQSLLRGFHGRLGAVGGPILNGILSCHIALMAAGYEVELSLRRLSAPSMARGMARILLPGLATIIFWACEKLLQQNLQSLPRTMTPLSLQLIHAAVFSAMSPSWLLLLGVPGALHTAFFNAHFSSLSVNAELGRHNWTLVDRAWSTTGYISVLENHLDDYRVMRCDHSLLGGEWLLTDQRRMREGWKVNEPTYAVFEMLEAVRLIENKIPIQDSDARALVIGLGIGTAPKALIAHGINTTIVELDPVVHEFATRYFDLPANHTSHIEDAVHWVEQQRRDSQADSRAVYDYIIHDVFTGGASPLSLFNKQFLQNLRKLLKPHGIIALNYAGDLSLPLTKRVLNTIEHVFNGRSQCKIFRDGPPPSNASASQSSSSMHTEHKQDATDKHLMPPADETATRDQQGEQDFLNMVVFCRNNADREPISFRQPTQADFLGSKSRQYYLLPNAEYEMPFPSQTVSSASIAESAENRAPVAILEAGDERTWDKQQIKSAIRHWHIMRDVVPDVVWDLW